MNDVVRIIVGGLVLGLPTYALGFAAPRGRGIGSAAGALVGGVAGGIGGAILGSGGDATLLIVSIILVGSVFAVLTALYAPRAVEIDRALTRARQNGGR